MTAVAVYLLGWLGPVGWLLLLAAAGVAATVFLNRWAAMAIVAGGSLIGAYLAGVHQADQATRLTALETRAKTAEATLRERERQHAEVVAALEADRAAAEARAEASRSMRERILTVRPEDNGPVARVLDDTLDHLGATR